MTQEQEEGMYTVGFCFDSPVFRELLPKVGYTVNPNINLPRRFLYAFLERDGPLYMMGEVSMRHPQVPPHKEKPCIYILYHVFSRGERLHPCPSLGHLPSVVDGSPLHMNICLDLPSRIEH